MPDNSHSFILQINQKDQEIENVKRRLCEYIESNAELQGRLELAMQRPSSLSVHSGAYEDNTNSSSDKDKLIQRFRSENRRLQE